MKSVHAKLNPEEIFSRGFVTQEEAEAVFTFVVIPAMFVGLFFLSLVCSFIGKVEFK